jgi:hypothetical protein
MRRKVIALFVAGAMALGVCGVAAAQWFLDFGTGAVTVGGSVDTVLISAPAGGPLFAGSGTETFTVTLTNVSGGNLYMANLATSGGVSSITFTGAPGCTPNACPDPGQEGTGLASNSNGEGGVNTSGGSGGIWNLAGTPGYDNSCLANNFTVGAFTPGTGTNPTQLATGGSPITWTSGSTLVYTFTVTLSGSAPIGCASTQPQLVVVA